MKFLVFLVSGSVVAVLSRLTIPGHELSYAGTVEAFQHIWVGVLLALCFSKNRDVWPVAISALVIISAIELLMFLFKT